MIHKNTYALCLNLVTNLVLNLVTVLGISCFSLRLMGLLKTLLQ